MALNPSQQYTQNISFSMLCHNISVTYEKTLSLMQYGTKCVTFIIYKINESHYTLYYSVLFIYLHEIIYEIEDVEDACLKLVVTN